MLFTALILSGAIHFASAEPITGTYASIDQNVVRLGQLAIIHIEPHPNRPLAISIADGTNTFRYNGQQISNTIGFQPQQTGEHTLIIRDASTGEQLEQLHFLVGELKDETTAPLDAISPPPAAQGSVATNGTAQEGTGQETVLPTRTHVVETDKQSYVLGEQVHITLANETGVGLNIVHGNDVFRFLGTVPESTTFEPTTPGAYRIVASGPQGAAIDSLVITVAAPQAAEQTGTEATAPPAPTEQSSPDQASATPPAAGENGTTDNFALEFQRTAQRFKVRDAHNKPLDGMLRIIERGKQPVVRSMLDAQAEALAGPTDLEFEPNASAVKHVHVSNMVSSSLDLGVDDFTGAPVQLPAGKDERKSAWTNLYAIDPSRANATSVTVTVTAAGSELFTCKDWDYANRECLGAWVKVRDLVPGENYTVTLDPADPGFGETISIPSGGWTEVDAGTTFTVKLCTDARCINTSTAFMPGDTVYVQVNATPAYIKNDTKNQLDIYSGADTGSILTVYYSGCTPAAEPYSYCQANFTIDPTWGTGWFYIDSEQHKNTGGGKAYTSFRTPFIVGTEPQSGDTLKFFVDNTYTTETEIFPAGSQLFVEFNMTPTYGTASANTVPVIRNMKTYAGSGGTTVTETWSNTGGPYRFYFTVPTITSTGWHFLEPAIVNTSGGSVPPGSSVHGRMFLIQANVVPSISNLTTNSLPAAPRSVGQALNWNISINDTNEVDKWIIFICSTNSFNATTRRCVNATVCSNTTYARLQSRTCEVTANSSMNTSSLAYAFVCDPRSCSTSKNVSWGVFNDTQAPSVSLITPIDDPTGSLPLTNFTVTFNFKPSDNYGIANCSLYTNSTGGFKRVAVNTTITSDTNNYITYTFPGDGSYAWNVFCSDYAGNTRSDDTNYTLVITGPPVVWLMSPASNTYFSTYNINLTYNATYGQNISNCSLYLDGASNQTHTAINNSVPDTFSPTFTQDGVHTWNVLCTGIDGASSFGDGITAVGASRLFTVDTQVPTVVLVSPGDREVINTSSATFIYTANDSSNVANCTVYVDGVVASIQNDPQMNVNQNIPFLLNNGNHPWYVTCADNAGNTVTSPSRTVIINSSSAGSALYYETDYGSTAPAAPANINLSTSIDNTSEAITTGISAYTMGIIARAITAPFQGNGIIISANSTVNFSALFATPTRNAGYITWKLYKSNGATDTIIAQAGDDSTGGTLITTNNNPVAYRDTAITPATPTRVLGTEWVKLQVDVYNNNNRRRTFTHYIDSLSSFVSFNFTRLGVLTTSITIPAVNLTIGVNDSFQLTCAYNCSGGACLNTNVYAERNTSTGWQTIPASGGIITLGIGEANPHPLGTTAFPGGITSFVLNGTALGTAAVRCNATSDYSNALVTDRRSIKVGTISVPTVILLTPPNNGFVNSIDLNLTYLPSSNKALDNCSLYVNGALNQTNTTPVKDQVNWFTLWSLPEASFNWSVSCTDSAGTRGNTSNFTFTVDRGPPIVNISNPLPYENFTTDAILFNWTAADTVASTLKCNITIDNVVRGLNINSPSGTPTNTTIGGIRIGTHYWNASCLDTAGNRNTSETWVFNITNLPTNVTLLGPPNGTWNSSGAIMLFYNITHQINSPPANCSLFINGVFNQTNATLVRMNQSNNFTVSTLTDGLYSWKVQCIASDGVQNTSATRHLYVDRTVPHINLTSPPDAQSLSIFNIPFSFNATDNMAPNMTCNLALDDVVNVSNIFVRNGVANTTTIRNIPDGVHTWNVSCVDPAGNGNMSLRYTFTTIAPPNVTPISPQNNGFSSSAALTLIYNVSENNAVASCLLYLDGAFSSANQTPIANNNLNSFTTPSLSEGMHSWNVSCTDVSGYAGSSPTYNVTIDTTKPIINLSLPQNNVVIRSPIAVVNWTVYDNIDANMLCNVTRYSALLGIDRSKANIGSPNASWTTAQYSGLPDDQYWWNVTCWDDARNANTSETWSFTISRPPVITPFSPAEGARLNNADVTFSYDATQSSGIANCTLILDGEQNATNSTVSTVDDNYFYATLEQGQHNWSVNCTDNTGGTQNSSVLRFVVDLTPPYINLTNPPDRSVQANNTIKFNYTPTDNQSSTMACNLTVNGTTYSPNQAVANGTSRIESVLLHGGNASYLWNVTCRDNANNYNTSITQSFNIIAPPIVRLIWPADNSGSSPNTTFIYYAQDPFGIKNCSLLLDGVVVNSSTSIANASNNNLSAHDIAEGGHLWTVTCYDNDDDTYTPTEFRMSSDFDPPVVLLNAPDPDTIFQTGNVAFNWTAYDDTSPNMSCTLYIDGVSKATNTSLNKTPTIAYLKLLPDGVRSWNVACADLVGNTNTSETRQITVNQTPQVTQGTPGINAVTNNGTVMFTYTPSDNDGFSNCSILINGAINTTNQTPVRNGVLNNITISLGTAKYNWSVLCVDNGTVLLQNLTSNRSLTVNLIPPLVDLGEPVPGLITNASTIIFNWTATDTFGAALSCNLTINNTVRVPGVNSPSGMLTPTALAGLNDSYQAWNVTCIDTAGNVNTSETRYFTVTAPPTISNPLPTNGLRTNNLTINFTFTPSDNSGIITACSLLINGAVNKTITNPKNAAQTNITVAGFVNGSYTWSLNCTDLFGNIGNTTNKTLLIDTLPPWINLTAPAHLSALGTNVTFNWTAWDTGTLVTCNLTLDGRVNLSNIAGTSGYPIARLVPNLDQGPHSWNVTCWDDLGQANTSETLNFSVNAPDLILNDTALIRFNNTNPNENDTINITANVTNTGGVPANNAVISFWDGDPASGGASIGNVTVTVQPNQSVIVSVAWNISLGFHAIYAAADYDNVVTEMDDTNNIASRNISVLRVLINSPQNATMTNNATPAVNFTVQNFTGGDFTYTIFVDGALTAKNGTITDNTSAAVMLSTLSEGVHRIIVQANDSLRAKNSTPLTIITDLTPPSAAFLTQNGTFFSQSPLNVTIRLTDTFDPSINYTIFVDGAGNATGYAANATNANVTLSGFSNGSYQLIIQSYDDAGNIANTTPITIFVDSVPPFVSLNSPDPGANFTNRTIRLNFTPTDNLDLLLQCNVTVDSGIIASYLNVTNGTSAAVTTAALSEGTHWWNVTCWDGNNNASQVNIANTSVTQSFNIYIPPNITVISPANNTLSNNATQIFLFNASDETGLANCSLIINGAINVTKAGAQLALNGTNNFTVSGLNNTIAWAVTCTDNSTGLATATSGAYNLTVDTTPPNASIVTANNTWFSTSTPSISVNATDNYAGTINITFYVDDAQNKNATASNGALTNVALAALPDGTHIVIAEATDTAGNKANSTAVTIYVDTVKPNVTLISPENATNLTSTAAELSFNATDNMAAVLACSVVLDGTVVQQYNLTNGTTGTYTAGGLASGWHYWNASCTDNATNLGASATFSFFVQLPDFVITAGNITLGNSTPIENQTIEVNATIFNIGQLNYTKNITAQFWLGDPDAGGKQLANFTIEGLNVSRSVTLSINYSAIIGLNQIYVVVDPPAATNGSITESNESNNKAHSDLWVGLFEVFAGGQAGDMRIADSSIIAAFVWNQTNVTGSNVFVADTDSAISFTSLQAIGRNTTNGTGVGANDFEEIDARMNTTALNDSVNRTFTAAGQPLGYMSLTAFKRSINQIPIINSTDTPSFVTGILWDTSDGGSYYNASQDIVFVTVMNQTRAGKYGTYDYEIAVPAKLRDYIAGGGTVTFYTELR
jgi:hypothetical protein